MYCGWFYIIRNINKNTRSPLRSQVRFHLVRQLYIPQQSLKVEHRVLNNTMPRWLDSRVEQNTAGRISVFRKLNLSCRHGSRSKTTRILVKAKTPYVTKTFYLNLLKGKLPSAVNQSTNLWSTHQFV